MLILGLAIYWSRSKYCMNTRKNMTMAAIRSNQWSAKRINTGYPANIVINTSLEYAERLYEKQDALIGERTLLRF